MFLQRVGEEVRQDDGLDLMGLRAAEDQLSAHVDGVLGNCDPRAFEIAATPAQCRSLPEPQTADGEQLHE
tara:strand:+ start:514 stop:723 length:210 start_codon:yes stop_codon:yes gene_type:complete